MTELKRNDLAPLHEQVADQLHQLIESLPPGARMPPELELVNRYRISRTTVRRAIGSLVDEGLLLRRRGSGTYTAPHRHEHQLDQLRPLASILAGSGGKPPNIQILEFEWTTDPALVTPLDVAEGLHLRRLYSVEDEPMALVDITVPGHIGQQISRAAVANTPMYEVLHHTLGISAHHGDVGLSSEQANADVASILTIQEQHPLLGMKRTTYDDSNNPIEYATYKLLPQYFELRLTVSNTSRTTTTTHQTQPTLIMRTAP